MMDVNAVVELFLSAGLWKLAVSTVCALVIKDIFQSIANTIFSYLKFKTDIIGVGTKVEYMRQIGVVRDSTMRRMTIDFEFEDGSRIRRMIPASDASKLVIIEEIRPKPHDEQK